MDRTAELSCPRCQNALEVGSYREVELALCAQGCQGTLLRNRDIIRLLEALGPDLGGVLPPEAELAPLTDQGGGLACPLCARPLEHHGYMGADLVFIDSCACCAVVWLDCEELGMMARLYHRVERRTAQRREEAERRQLESDRTFDALQAIHAARRGRHLARADLGALMGKSLLLDFVSTGLKFFL